jgi:hypothetical protein
MILENVVQTLIVPMVLGIEKLVVVAVLIVQNVNG